MSSGRINEDGRHFLGWLTREIARDQDLRLHKISVPVGSFLMTPQLEVNPEKLLVPWIACPHKFLAPPALHQLSGKSKPVSPRDLQLTVPKIQL